MGDLTSEYRATYTSFSGADIVATFNETVIGSLQAISYSVTREKVPIYTLGNPNPRSFSRGKRGIAGSLVFTQFDKDVLHEFKKTGENNITTAYANAVINTGGSENIQILSVDQWEAEIAAQMSSQNTGFGTRPAYYTDEILPFDITITMKNEYGQGATFSVLGVELLNEGSGFSIDDITSEKACTFVARDLSPIRPVSASASNLSVIDSSRN